MSYLPSVMCETNFNWSCSQTTRTTAVWGPGCRISWARLRTAGPRTRNKTRRRSARSSAPRCRRPGTNRTRWPCPTGTWPPPPPYTIIITRNRPCGTRAVSTAEWVSDSIFYYSFRLPKSVFSSFSGDATKQETKNNNKNPRSQWLCTLNVQLLFVAYVIHINYLSVLYTDIWMFAYSASYGFAVFVDYNGVPLISHEIAKSL